MTKNGLFVTGLVFIAVGVVGIILIGLAPGAWWGPNSVGGWWGSMGNMMGGQGMMNGGGMMGRGARPRSFSSNGERIYYTAASESGSDISASMGGMTMSAPAMSCVDCHQADGRGGRVTMPMGTFTAHNITYKELTKEEKPPYTDELIKRAITKGLDHKGKRLNFMMPKWRMSDGDLNDLIDYLKTLD